MIISIEDHIKQYNKHPDYLRSKITKTTNGAKLVDYGMMKWSEDAYCWAGDWSGYVFFSIINYADEYPYLKSMIEINEEEKTYHRYSKYSWPYGFCNKVFGSGWDIINNEDGTQSYRSRLTHLELLKLREYSLNSKDYNDNQAYPSYQDKIFEAEQEIHWHLECPSMELPIILYMCGTDDISYSKLFDSI